MFPAWWALTLADGLKLFCLMGLNFFQPYGPKLKLMDIVIAWWAWTPAWWALMPFWWTGSPDWTVKKISLMFTEFFLHTMCADFSALLIVSTIFSAVLVAGFSHASGTTFGHHMSRPQDTQLRGCLGESAWAKRQRHTKQPRHRDKVQMGEEFILFGGNAEFIYISKKGAYLLPSEFCM